MLMSFIFELNNIAMFFASGPLSHKIAEIMILLCEIIRLCSLSLSNLIADKKCLSDFYCSKKKQINKHEKELNKK